ncbi:hypothetical protein [Nostoc sp.]|uniref:hypothetical protein n=1 Tax=Nostoc sp. TaxID=1180 RepID=UPI002FF50A1E
MKSLLGLLPRAVGLQTAEKAPNSSTIFALSLDECRFPQLSFHSSDNCPVYIPGLRSLSSQPYPVGDKAMLAHLGANSGIALSSELS